MIKADAYGHGAVRVAQSLVGAGAKVLGVSLIEEAVELRQAGINIPLLVFGLNDSQGIGGLEQFQLTPVISDFEGLLALRNLKTKKPFEIHLKFNTGMNRLGFDLFEIEKVITELRQNSCLVVSGICTHLLNGEDVADPKGYTAHQMREFAKLKKYFPEPKVISHALNSAGLIGYSFHQKRLVEDGWSWPLGSRVGLALYGVHPEMNPRIPLEEVMSVKTKLGLIRKVKAGSAISYGATFKTQRDSLIGVIPQGYADGLRRSFSNQGEVLIAGTRVPIVGTVCMDLTIVDLTDLAKSGVTPHLNDEVVVIGAQGNEFIGLGEWARKLGTIPYEVMTSQGVRMFRTYLDH